MSKALLPLALGLSLLPSITLAQADADGFTNPLQELKFNPHLDQREFERATFSALNVYDPWEPFNRYIYHFNYHADQWVLRPVVSGYRAVTPSFVRTGVSNFFNHIDDMPSLVNSVLQLKWERSLHITARLIFNTTLGVGGLWDPASKMGLARQKNDFGQTLGVYGIGAGPYLMLPLLGPSNVRDTTGFGLDYVLNSQINYLNTTEHAAVTLLHAIDARHQTSMYYGQLNSPFEYEKIRYVYSVARELKIAE